MESPVCVLGAGAGFAGDRIDPAVVLARSGVDAVVLECLAERTLVPAIRARRDNPQAGYDPRLVRRLTPLLPVAREKGCRIVSNLGAANPVAAAERIARLARELDAADADVARREARLGSEQFVARAPAAVVQRERDGLAAARDAVARLRQRLDDVSDPA